MTDATCCSGLFARKERWTLTWPGRALAAAIILAVILTLFLGAAPFLAVTEPVQADVMVAEGWLPNAELAETWRLFQTGHYSLLLTTGGVINKRIQGAPDNTFAELAAHVLQHKFGPSSSIHAVPAHAVRRDRTYTSALALKEWLRENRPQVRSINLVSMGPHARRSRMLFEKALGPDFRVGVISLPDDEFDWRHWWRSEEGCTEMAAEGFAYLYARFLFYP